MSKSSASRASAILVGLSLLAASVYPVLAQDSTNSALKANPGNAVAAAAARKQLVQQRVDTRKENIGNKIAAMKEQIASKAAALKTRLQTFKDQRKATLAEKINTNLNNINENQTAQMQKHLGTMSSILDRLETRVNQGTSDVKDPAAAKVAIASARAAISTASAAVTAQTQKDYTVTVTSEGRIGLDVKTQRDRLHTDIQTVRKLVIDAKQSVANAIRVAKSGNTPVGRTVTEKEGTNSGQQ